MVQCPAVFEKVYIFIDFGIMFMCAKSGGNTTLMSPYPIFVNDLGTYTLEPYKTYYVSYYPFGLGSVVIKHKLVNHWDVRRALGALWASGASKALEAFKCHGP